MIIFPIRKRLPTSPEGEGVYADGVDRDGAKREEGAAESNYRNRNWTSLRLTIA